MIMLRGSMIIVDDYITRGATSFVQNLGYTTPCLYNISFIQHLICTKLVYKTTHLYNTHFYNISFVQHLGYTTLGYTTL